MSSASGKTPLILLALAALLAGAFLFLSLDKPQRIAHTQQKIPGLLWPAPKPLTVFELRDQNNTPFTLEDLKGRWSMLFFGYTHCPDVCPTTMTLLDSVVDELKSEKKSAPQVVFITIDPERDTPKHLADYITYFNPDFRGLSGTPEKLSILTGQLGILSMKVDDQKTGKEGYIMDHTASIFLIGPEARLIGVFSPPHNKEDIMQRYLEMRKFIEKQASS